MLSGRIDCVENIVSFFWLFSSVFILCMVLKVMPLSRDRHTFVVFSLEIEEFNE